MEKLEAWRFEVAHRQDKRLTRFLRKNMFDNTMNPQVGRGGDAWFGKKVNFFDQYHLIRISEDELL